MYDNFTYLICVQSTNYEFEEYCYTTKVQMTVVLIAKIFKYHIKIKSHKNVENLINYYFISNNMQKIMNKVHFGRRFFTEKYKFKNRKINDILTKSFFRLDFIYVEGRGTSEKRRRDRVADQRRE